MSAASWVLIVWLVIQLFVMVRRRFNEDLSPAKALGAGLGAGSWFGLMVALIYLSGGWQ